jgi:hypothetical protein
MTGEQIVYIHNTPVSYCTTLARPKSVDNPCEAQTQQIMQQGSHSTPFCRLASSRSAYSIRTDNTTAQDVLIPLIVPTVWPWRVNEDLAMLADPVAPVFTRNRVMPEATPPTLVETFMLVFSVADIDEE